MLSKIELPDVYSWFMKDTNTTTIKNLSDNQILNFACNANNLFAKTNLIETKPDLSLSRLVVVGTQSSGKSSVLNSIIGIDFLPTGKNMVTRTPLDIRLIKIVDKTDGWVEFGHYDNADWVCDAKVSIKIPTPTTEEISKIRAIIAKLTTELAGVGMNISPEPILVKIYSPEVPNLNLIDLPGLTMVACTDKGQPEDIRERIEQLVTSYIKDSKTIIIAVMQAKSDLETDLGLALIKKHDANGRRTIGVLTKPDLMNFETHIGDYLTNNISKNLMLTYGYYVVKNRTDKEATTMNILQGFEAEKNYFMSHSEYKKTIYKDRIGIQNLTENLSKILIAAISELIPSVMSEIMELEVKINKKIDQMGLNLPTTKEGKLSVLNKYVSNYYSRFYDSIESRGNILNTGKQIKDIFVEYRKELDAIHPFNNSKIYTDEYFKHIISSFEGNHMSFHIPPIQVLESCMTDPQYRPIYILQDKSLRCVDSVCETLIDLIKKISQLEEFSQFPPLSNHIINSLIENVITELKSKSKHKILEVLKHEEDYIWTDSKEFSEALTKINISNNQKFDSSIIKQLLEVYYKTVVNTVSNMIPKIIMSNIVREMEKSVLPYLFQHVVTEDKINLLREDETVEKQRKYYLDISANIESIKKNFSKNY